MAPKGGSTNMPSLLLLYSSVTYKINTWPFDWTVCTDGG